MRGLERGKGYGYTIWCLLGILWVASVPLTGMQTENVRRTVVLAVNLLTVCITYAVFRNIFDDTRIALIGCLLYTWAPYRFYDLYIRGAFWESLALCFLPLAVLGLYRAARREKWGWPVAAIGVAGYVIPLLRQLINDAPSYTNDPWVQHRGMYFLQYLTVFARGGTNAQVTGTGTADAAPRGIGFAVTLSVLLYLWSCFTGRYRERRCAQNGELTALNRLCRVGMGVGTAALALSLTAFPWDALRRLSGILDWLITGMQTPACFVPIALTGFVVTACGVLKILALSERKETATAILLTVAATAFATTWLLAADLLDTDATEELTTETAALEALTAVGYGPWIGAVILLLLLAGGAAALYVYLGKHQVCWQRLAVWFGVPTLAVIASLPTFTDYALAAGDGLAWWSGLALTTALRMLGFPLAMSYNFYIMGVNLATAIAAYAAFRGIFDDEVTGLLGCMLYTLAPCRIAAIYQRGAIGGYTAMIFLPLLCWGAYRLGAALLRRVSLTLPADVALAAAVLLCIFLPWLERIASDEASQPEIARAAVIAAAIGAALLPCAAGAWVRHQKSTLVRRSFYALVCGGTLLYALYQTNEILMTGTALLRIWSAAS